MGVPDITAITERSAVQPQCSMAQGSYGEWGASAACPAAPQQPSQQQSPAIGNMQHQPLFWHAPKTRAHQGLHIKHVALGWRQRGRHTANLLLCLLSPHAWLQPHCTARHTKAAGITADEGHTASCSPRTTTGATTIAPR